MQQSESLIELTDALTLPDPTERTFADVVNLLNNDFSNLALKRLIELNSEYQQMPDSVKRKFRILVIVVCVQCMSPLFPSGMMGDPSFLLIQYGFPLPTKSDLQDIQKSVGYRKHLDGRMKEFNEKLLKDKDTPYNEIIQGQIRKYWDLLCQINSLVSCAGASIVARNYFLM